jgi:hypothetical protein
VLAQDLRNGLAQIAPARPVVASGEVAVKFETMDVAEPVKLLASSGNVHEEQAAKLRRMADEVSG